MSRIFWIFVLIFSLSTNLYCFAQERSDSYFSWFEQFWKKWDWFQPMLTDYEKRELDDLLNLKPTLGSGKYFNAWFVKVCAYIQDSEPMMDSNERDFFRYLEAAKPSVQDSQEYFSFYLDYVCKKFDDYLPLFQGSEKEFLELVKRSKPRGSEKDYSIWLERYSKFKDDLGPSYSDDEKYVLQFMMDIKPSSGGEENGSCEVEIWRLRKIRNLIIDHHNSEAVNELDRILNNSSKEPGKSVFNIAPPLHPENSEVR